MSWASGSSLFSQVWKVVRPHIPKGAKADVAEKIMDAFENEDCDTLMECMDDDWPEIEEAYRRIHPPADFD